MLTTLRRRAVLLGTAATLSMALAACGSDDGGGDDATTDVSAEEDTSAEDMSEDEMSDEEMSDEEMSEDEMSDAEMSDAEMSEEEASEDDAASGDTTATGPIGDGCPEGAADLSGTSLTEVLADTDGLGTLLTAVQAAGIEETLASMEDVTVFAPVDAAFDALPAGDLEALLADPEQLTIILQTHVVEQTVVSGDISLGTPVATAAGTEVTAEEGSGELPMLTTGSSSAQMICADIVAENATIHLIDGVLVP